MTAVAETIQNVSPNVTAALLLAAGIKAARLGLPHPKVAEILEATGAGRSRAYELAKAIPEAVADLVRPQGRPPLSFPATPSDAVSELRGKVIAYFIDHPGCATSGGRRHNYSVEYRLFVLELYEGQAELDVTAFAEAVMVPLPTLRDWLRAPRSEPEPPDDETIDRQDAASARIETILDEWDKWAGDFVPFCDHLRKHLRIEWGTTMISGILEKVGVRRRRRRKGRPRDDGTLRGAFETFFPGAQWGGDGSSMSVEIGPCRFTFNAELMVDAHSDAFVGLSIRDEEDSEAVIEAFDDGVTTTESPPIAVELDGRPSNHCDEVGQATGETIIIRSTPGKPQSNPYVEGSFGLFEQTAPPLVVDGHNRKEIARQILALVLVTWARTLNHNSRRDRGGCSRVDLYRDTEPTEEEVERAREALRKRQRRQERMLETRRARANATVRAVVDGQWSKLDLDDPEGRVRDVISTYPLDTVLAAIATYEGKRNCNTLPPGVDARYLFGIVRNISQTDEGQAITEALLRIRVEARDVMLSRLVEARDALLASTKEPGSLLRAAIDNAMGAHRNLDRLFWLELAAKLITDQDASLHAGLVRSVSRRIHACFAVPYWERLAAVRFLAKQVVSLA